MTGQPEIWERGYEVEELLGKRPAWITRWGTLVFILFFALVITGSWIIQYPDILVSPVVVSSENPPATLVARVDGRITGLYVKDHQVVSTGDVLAVIENPANYADILSLENLLKRIQVDSSQLDDFFPSLEKTSFILGDVQLFYSAFHKAISDFHQFLKVKEFPDKVKALKEEEKMTRAYIGRLRIQGQVMEKDLKLGKQQFLRDSALFIQKVIASSDFEKSESTYLQKKYALEGSRVNLANSQIQLSQLQKDILDLSLQYRQRKNELIRNAVKSQQELLNQVETWKQQYLLISPINGQLSFNQFWHLNQQLKAGDEVLTVVPPGKTKIIGKVSLNVEGAGKVKAGQRVNVKFSNYPFLEFGMVKAKVAGKSLVPQHNKYTLELSFPEGLVTSYGKKLDYQPEMTGTAEIVTDDVRLLERLINPIRHLISNN